MHGNMSWWYLHVLKLSEQLQLVIINASDLEQSEDEAKRAYALEQLKTARAMLKEILVSRDKAQGCAVDLAPYVHPKLTSIAFTPTPKKLTKQALSTDPIEASKSYQRFLSGG